jgi:hypothetical protein
MGASRRGRRNLVFFGALDDGLTDSFLARDMYVSSQGGTCFTAVLEQHFGLGRFSSRTYCHSRTLRFSLATTPSECRPSQRLLFQQTVTRRNGHLTAGGLTNLFPFSLFLFYTKRGQRPRDSGSCRSRIEGGKGSSQTGKQHTHDNTRPTCTTSPAEMRQARKDGGEIGGFAEEKAISFFRRAGPNSWDGSGRQI